MFDGPQHRLLPDGRRLHLNHGPIDLVIQAFGAQSEIDAAYEQASDHFSSLLTDLVCELDHLRKPLEDPRWQPYGSVARRMTAVCWPHREIFVTPMAAVAGSVADEILAALCCNRSLDRAYVNNGGDIAIHLARGAMLTAGLVGDYHLPAIDATCLLTHDSPVRGIATSGWKGRSHSFGIADSVTVLARTAAAADVAATLIANAVNVEDPVIERAPASDLDPDSDLGARSVTVAVGDLGEDKVKDALAAGASAAEKMHRAGHMVAAVLVLRQQFRAVGSLPAGLISETAA